MKWNADLLNAEEGSTRVVKRFLLFPRILLTKKGIFEWRWLEWAGIVKQRRCTVDMVGGRCLEWRAVEWEEK